jgi:hypothetical protein
VQQLDAAIDAHQTVAHEQGMLPAEERLVHADGFVTLYGEDEEVHEELDEEEIVDLVRDQNKDIVD